MLLIINLGIILSLLIIVLFDIVNIKNQILVTLYTLVILFLFKIIFDKMIKNNKRNINGKEFNRKVNNSNLKNNSGSCVYRSDGKRQNNSFDLNNLDNIVKELKNISKSEESTNLENNEDKRIIIDKDGSGYIFGEESGNEDFHYKDLHNKSINARLNSSDAESLLLDNVDCTNDNSCIIEPSIYNFHKY